MVFYEGELQENSTESKIIEFDFDFAKKMKIKLRVISKIENHELNENKLEIKLNY